VMVCILLAIPCMLERIGRSALVIAILTFAAAPAIAHGDWQPSSHVRPDIGLRRLVEDAARRSPAIRQLVDRLEALDVTVYIRIRPFSQTDLDGRVALLSSNGGHRYLVIELACGRSEIVQMATLGHELYHAVEIAAEPSVVDARTLATYYARIGMLTGDSDGRRTFETQAAAAAGERVRRELVTSGTRNSNGT
jgi:hypothetical protein